MTCSCSSKLDAHDAPTTGPPATRTGSPADNQGHHPGQRHVVLEEHDIPGRHVDRVPGLRDVRR